MIAPDAFDVFGVCGVCGRDSCEDHELDDMTAPAPSLPSTNSDRPLTRSLLGFSLDALRVHRFPPRRALLCRGDAAILRAGHLGEVFAERGIGKTWLLQSLALASASSATVLGFHAPSPCSTLYIDGEMGSEEIQDRFSLQRDHLQIGDGIPLTVLGADWQEEYLPRLDTTLGQELVEPFIGPADLIILDNRSCLFDPEGEKDPTAWQPAQDWLLSLRRRGKAVLMAHHANRQGGARGHSKAEDPLNLILKLTRPDDYSAEQGSRFVVTFEKCRGAYGPDVAPFTARLTAEGWQVDGTGGTHSVADRLREYVRLADEAGEPVRSANAAIGKVRVNRNEALKAWAAMTEAGTIRKRSDGGFHVA